MESFWGTLKTELVHHEQYATRAEARASIFEYIEVFYNRKRLHSSLGYMSPEAFEASLKWFPPPRPPFVGKPSRTARAAHRPNKKSPGSSSEASPTIPHSAFRIPHSEFRIYFTNWLSLKIGRMILIAMKPTTLPIATIISGSIIAVTPLITAFSSRA